jgi:hydrogenase/urease accessory protein HupE
MKKLRMLSCLLLVMIFGSVNADIFRPAYLEIRESGNDTYDVLWKVPALGDNQRLAIYVRFPDSTEQLTTSSPFITDGAWVERWKIRHEGSLVGEIVRIEGNAAGVSDVVARVERLDGSSQVERLGLGALHFEVRAPAGTGEIAWSYTVLGIEHILAGFDHLLFVLALLLIVRGGKRIIATVTAFTVAHSITLVAATTGWVNVPGPPVEAIIALSIVFVAAEVLHGINGKPGLTARAPWLVAFSFGLLHGLGFAGALAEIGLPQNAIPVALLMFNIGVEIGQLIFVASVLIVGVAISRFVSRNTEWAIPVTAYGVGSIAAFWTIERVISFWI